MQILFFKHCIFVFDDTMQRIYIFIRFLWNIYILLFLDIYFYENLYKSNYCEMNENEITMNKKKHQANDNCLAINKRSNKLFTIAM